MKKAKTYKYHKYHSYFNQNGKKIECRTHLHQIGVYCIINNDSNLQFHLEPKGMVSIEKRLNKKLEENKISDLEFSGEIEVTEENGFYVEVIKK